MREANRHPSFHRRARLGLETHPYPHCPWQKLAKQEIEVGDGHVTKGQAGVILQGGEPPAVWKELCELTQGSLIPHPLHEPKATLHPYPQGTEDREGSCHPSLAPLFFGLTTLWELCPRSLEAFFEIPVGGWGCHTVPSVLAWHADSSVFHL